MGYLQNHSNMKLQNLTYAGKRKNWKFDQSVTAHKYQHTILKVLTYHGYNRLDNRTKVTCMMEDVKVDSLNTAKAIILTNRDF